MVHLPSLSDLDPDEPMPNIEGMCHQCGAFLGCDCVEPFFTPPQSPALQDFDQANHNPTTPTPNLHVPPSTPTTDQSDQIPSWSSSSVYPTASNSALPELPKHLRGGSWSYSPSNCELTTLFDPQLFGWILPPCDNDDLSALHIDGPNLEKFFLNLSQLPLNIRDANSLRLDKYARLFLEALEAHHNRAESTNSQMATNNEGEA